MKRAAPWEKDALNAASDDTSDSDSEDDGPSSINMKSKGNVSTKSKENTINASSAKKYGAINYNALSRHGYRGGPSVLDVPEPTVEHEDWSWSKGKKENEANQETYEEREHTRSVAAGQTLLNVQKRQPAATDKEKNMSFSQKEKRKRDLGQASRGKSYVEEEKRLLRDSGVYSGFDS